MKPTKPLIVITASWALLGFIAAFFPWFREIWLPFGIIFGIIVLFDAINSFRKPLLRIERQVSHNLPVNSWTNVNLLVHNRGNLQYTLELFDLYPAHFESENLPLSVRVKPNQFAQLLYRLKPTKRGDAEFKGIELRIRSHMAMWFRKRVYRNEETVKVYPNFADVSKYALLATDNQLSLLGIRQRVRRGQGLEFHQLREYREGDSMRQIDWKATSRYRKLISREYQDERDQQVVFMVDCGRRMRTEDNELNHFDQSLNAMLLLSYVALRQGDSVSILAFGGQERRFSARKGINQINEILNQTYDLQSTLAVSDYATAAQQLLVHQRKRSLVVILTNARDEDQDNLLSAIHLLRTRHLVLVANLREEILDNIMEEPVSNFDQAIRYASVTEYLATREQNHRVLAGSGAITLNITARELPIAIVNKYLDIKQSNML